MPSRWSRAARTSLKTLACASLLGAGLALAGCQTDGAPFAETSSTPAVAFEQIDGLPRPTFDALVASLGPAAETHKVDTVSRTTDAPYRVTGTFALETAGKKTALAYSWDVVDRTGTRVARLTGTEPLNVPRGAKDPWVACDEKVLTQVAERTMADLSETLSGGQPGALASADGTAQPAPAAAPSPEAKPNGAPQRAAQATGQGAINGAVHRARDGARKLATGTELALADRLPQQAAAPHPGSSDAAPSILSYAAR